MREIMLVPFPLASSSDLISFFTFQISTFLSACSAVSLILPALHNDGEVELKLILKQEKLLETKLLFCLSHDISLNLTGVRLAQRICGLVNRPMAWVENWIQMFKISQF